MISPNKQNLLKLKKQKKLVGNGLKLLTEKRNSLIILFLNLAKEGKKKQIELSDLWGTFFKRYVQDFGLVNIKKLLQRLYPGVKSKIEIKQKRVSGVYLDEISLNLASGERNELKPALSNSLKNFKTIFPQFILLAQIKTNCMKISQEIIKTNRQINNLERKVEVVDFEIKYVTSALLEKSNSEKAILIKIFS